MFLKIFRSRTILIGAVALFLTSCAGLQVDLSRYAPDITLKNVDLENIDLAGVDLNFTYEIKNKVDFEIIFSTLAFEIFADGRKLFNGTNKKNITLKPLGKSQFTITHRLEFNQLDKNLAQIYSKDEIEVALQGKVGIYLKWIKQSLTVPIQGKKMTPVPKLPEVTFQDFRLQKSNLTTLNPSATFQLKLLVKNPNKFDVGVEKISYQFIVEQSNLARGKTSSLQIPPQQTRTITIPVTLQGTEALTLTPKLKDLSRLKYRVSGAITLNLAGKIFDIDYAYP